MRAGRYNTIVEIRRSIKVGRSGLEGTGGGGSRCRMGLSGGLSEELAPVDGARGLKCGRWSAGILWVRRDARGLEVADGLAEGNQEGLKEKEQTPAA